MVIVLIFFIVLAFPIKLHSQGRISFSNGYIYLNLFLYKIKLLSLKIFPYRKFFYYKINRNKPKKLLINLKNDNKAKRKFNFIILNSVKISINVKTKNPVLTTFIAQSLGIISPFFTHFKDIRVGICATTNFVFSNSIKADARGYTNLFYLLLSLIERIVKRGGKHV